MPVWCGGEPAADGGDKTSGGVGVDTVGPDRVDELVVGGPEWVEGEVGGDLGVQGSPTFGFGSVGPHVDRAEYRDAGGVGLV